MVKYCFKILRIVSVLVFQLLFSFSLTGQSLEYAVKSTLLLKIAQNIEWSNLDKMNQFTIQVIGNSPFKSEFEDSSQKIVVIQGLPINILYENGILKQNRPQLVFICDSEKKILDLIINSVKTDPNTLIVSDSPEFSGKGVHINFYNKADGSIHFELDLKAFQGNELRPSIQLLKISKILR